VRTSAADAVVVKRELVEALSKRVVPMANEHVYRRWIDNLFQHGTSAGLDEGQLLER
jgi:hypothetical protein